VGIYYMDTVRALLEMVEYSDKVAVLSFASNHKVVSGYTTGSNSQETILARCIPDMYVSLAATDKYPVFDDDNKKIEETKFFRPMVYSLSGQVRRDSNYNLVDGPTVTVIGAVPFNLDRGEKFIIEEAKETLRSVFGAAVKAGCDTLVLGPWGCGNFKCNPRLIAKLMNSVHQEFGGHFKNIVYAVMGVKETKAFEDCIECQD
jgi:uncharacterized protein (TIGR02452 family)